MCLWFGLWVNHSFELERSHKGKTIWVFYAKVLTWKAVLCPPGVVLLGTSSSQARASVSVLHQRVETFVCVWPVQRTPCLPCSCPPSREEVHSLDAFATQELSHGRLENTCAGVTGRLPSVGWRDTSLLIRGASCPQSPGEPELCVTRRIHLTSSQTEWKKASFDFFFFPESTRNYL